MTFIPAKSRVRREQAELGREISETARCTFLMLSAIRAVTQLR
jgi:hypothetical protein